MNLDRSFKIKQSAKQAIYSCYSMAKIGKSTSNQLHKNLRQVSELLPKGTPYHVISFLNGMKEVLSEQLYRNELEFCYTIDGVIYSVYKNSERYYEKHNITPKQLCDDADKSGHYWIGTDKPYFIGYDKK